MSLLLALASAASAHYPHDAATWVAIGPGADPAWVVTSLWRTEAWMVARTADDADVDVRFVIHGERYVMSAALLADERLVLGTEGDGLWVSEDAGDSFSVHPDLGPAAVVHQVVASPAVEADGVALAAGEGSLWRTGDAGLSWSAVLSAPETTFLDLDLSPGFAEDGRACAISDLGDAWCSSDAGETWTAVEPTGGAPWKISIGADGVLWVGDEDGLLRSPDGGSTWERVAFEGEDVVVVEDFGDGLVLAATRKEAAWRSEDSGATWTLCADHLEPPQDGQGGPRAEEHYFELRESGDGAIYLASWEGLARSDDRGRTWTRVHTEHQSVVRGLELSRGEDGRLQALLATYGGGVSLVDALAPTGAPVSTDAPVRYLRAVAATPDWGSDGVALFTGAGKAYFTTDGARTWTEAGPGLEDLQRVAASRDWPADPRLAVAGSRGGTVDFATSTDGGATWSHGEVGECAGGASALFHSWAWAEDGAAWGACQVDGAVFETRDRGSTWTLLGRAGSTVFALAGAPAGARVFAGATDGLYACEPGGALSRVAFEGRQVQALAISPDWEALPTVFVALAAGGWWRSDDGGDTWTALDPPTGDFPLAVAVSPDYATDGVVAFAGYGGAWVSADRGATWRWANVVELHEEDSPQWIFEGEWALGEQAGASGGRARSSAVAGDRGELVFEGVRVELIGGGSGRAKVRIDGGPEEEAQFGEGEWSSQALADGWHTLEVEVVDGDVAIDAARVWRQEGEEEGETGAPETRCGCGSGGGAVVLPVWVVGRKRRRGGDRAKRGAPMAPVSWMRMGCSHLPGG